MSEFFEAFAGVDRSVFSLMKNLAIQPGVTAREYVLEKKRKKYFNPFSFLLIVLGLNISVNLLVKPYTHSFSDKKPTVQQTTPTIPPNRLPYVARQRAASTFIEENINLVGLLAIPIMAFIFWLCFLKTGIYYSEHLVSMVFFSSFFSLVSILITLVLGFLFDQYLPYLNRLLLFFQLIYLTIAYYQLLGFRQPVRYAKTGAVTLLALVTWFIASGGVVFLYIRFGP